MVEHSYILLLSFSVLRNACGNNIQSSSFFFEVLTYNFRGIDLYCIGRPRGIRTPIFKFDKVNASQRHNPQVRILVRLRSIYFLYINLNLHNSYSTPQARYVSARTDLHVRANSAPTLWTFEFL